MHTSFLPSSRKKAQLSTSKKYAVAGLTGTRACLFELLLLELQANQEHAVHTRTDKETATAAFSVCFQSMRHLSAASSLAPAKDNQTECKGAGGWTRSRRGGWTR